MGAEGRAGGPGVEGVGGDTHAFSKRLVVLAVFETGVWNFRSCYSGKWLDRVEIEPIICVLLVQCSNN